MVDKLCLLYHIKPLTSKDDLSRHSKTVQSLLPREEWCLNTVRMREAGRRRCALRTQDTNIINISAAKWFINFNLFIRTTLPASTATVPFVLIDTYFWWFKWIIWWELYCQEKHTTLVGAVRLKRR